MKISEKISFLRKRKRLSQEQLAMKLDVSRQAVYKWEADISVPEIDKIKKLALVFDVSYDFLLNDSLDISCLEESCEQVPLADEGMQNDDILDEQQSEVAQGEPSIAEPMMASEQASAPTSTVAPQKSNRKRKLALIICLCVLGGILFLSLFTISLIKLLNELDIYTGSTDSGSTDTGSSDTSTDSSSSLQTHQVYFELPDGTVLKAEGVGSGMTTSAPSAPTITGYNFKGWYVGTEAWNKNMTYTESTTIKAVYEPVEYEIRYIYNGNIMTDVGPTTYTIENEVALPTVSKEGYAFKGWYADSSFLFKLDKIEQGTHKNINVYACFEKNSHKINYVLYGGTNSYQNPSIYTINTTVSLKSPTHVDENASFGGWYYDANFEKPAGIILSGITKDITLYAKWEHKLYDFSCTDENCTIIGYKGKDTDSPKIIYIPQTFLNMPIISIAPYAFENHVIGELHLSDEILVLSDNAFSGASIKKIYISKNVMQISTTAFVDCAGLESIEVTSSNPWYSDIDGVAFNKEGTRLLKYPQGRADTSYSLPDTTNFVEAYAFYGCTSLTEVSFPNRVGGIDNCAFKNCTSLRKIDLGDILNYIGKETFRNCSKLTEIEFPYKLYSIGNYAFDGCIRLESVKITKGVDVLGYSVFSNCSALASVDLGEECSEISSRVFENCISLQSITIPETVSKIGSEAFVGCEALTSVKINTNAIWTLYDKDADATIRLTNEQASDPSRVASFITRYYSHCVWNSNDDIVVITYNADSGTLKENEKIQFVTTGSRVSYHPTPTHTDPSMLFVGWFSNSTLESAIDPTYRFDSNITLYAKWEKQVLCVNGTYTHNWGQFECTQEADCYNAQEWTRVCGDCGIKDVKIEGEPIGHIYGAPYENGFSFTYDCLNNCGESKVVPFTRIEADNISISIKEGSVFAPENLDNLINGVFNEENSAVVANKGTDRVVISLELITPERLDRVYVKGRGSTSAFVVQVLYEGDSEYTTVGSGRFGNPLGGDDIPYASLLGGKKTVAVQVIMSGTTTSDYWEEIALYNLPDTI